MLELTTAAIGFRTVLTVSGAINSATVEALEDALEALLRSSAREVWVDLTDVTFIDPAGVTALLSLAGQIEARNGRLALIAPAGPARRSLRLAGADGRFSLFADRAHAHHSS